MSLRGSVVLIALFFAAMQVFALPPDGFVTGDQGSKYLQTRAFAEHGPLNPSIDVAAHDIDPDYRHQEPKLKNRRGRLVSEFLWLLPLMSAPFFAVLGMRGLYVVPALSVIVIFLAAAALGRRAGEDRGLWTAWIVAIATPVLVYGLELWEHAPAAASVLVAAALLAPERLTVHGSRFTVGGSRLAVDGSRLAVDGSQLTVDGSRSAVDGSQLAVDGSRLAVDGSGFAINGSRLAVGGLRAAAGGLPLRAMLAGAAIMVGTLFREEVAPALPALLIARAISLDRDRLKDLIVTGAWTALGAAVVFAASVPVNLMIYGAPLPMHVTQDAWEVAKNTPYMQVRRDVLVDLLLPASHTALFIVALLAGLGASLAHHRRRRNGAAGDDRALLAIVHVSAIVVLAIVVALPLWRLVQGVRPHDAYRVTSAAHTWPFALAILYWPWVADERSRPLMRFLVVSALLLLAGTALIVPTSGGAQWSPRFLIAVAPLLAVVAAAVARPGSNLPPARAAIAWMACGILLASFVMQASGVFYVQRAKARNAQLTHWLALRTAPGDVLITDLFWFNEVTATLASTRRMLFSWRSADVPEMAAMATSRGLPRFSIVTSTPLTGYEAPATLDVPGAPCRFVRGQRVALDELGLWMNRYGCEGP
jgi:hypothetical protein